MPKKQFTRSINELIDELKARKDNIKNFVGSHLLNSLAVEMYVSEEGILRAVHLFYSDL